MTDPTRRKFLTTTAGAATVAATTSGVALATGSAPGSVPGPNRILELLQRPPHQSLEYALDAIRDYVVPGGEEFIVKFCADCAVHSAGDNPEIQAAARNVRNLRLKPLGCGADFLVQCAADVGDRAAEQAFAKAYRGKLKGFADIGGINDSYQELDGSSCTIGAIINNFETDGIYTTISDNVFNNYQSHVEEAATIAGIAYAKAYASEEKWQLTHAIELARVFVPKGAS